VKVSLSSATSE